jgi:hypothetical protein
VFQKYLARWDDANQLASVSTRVTLNGPVATLQTIRRDAQAEQWPDCAKPAAQLMDQAMKTEIDAYVTWMGIDYSDHNPACSGLSEYQCAQAIGDGAAQAKFDQPAMDKFSAAKSQWAAFQTPYAKITGSGSQTSGASPGCPAGSAPAEVRDGQVVCK